MRALEREVRLGSRRQRRRARRELDRAINQLAARAEARDVVVWRVQPIVEVAAPESYPAWGQTRERRWRR